MRVSLLCLSMSVAALSACSGARSPAQRAALESAGARLFAQNCTQCHPGGQGGVGPSLIDAAYLPGWWIRHEVRSGPKQMPAFTETQMSDDDLEALIAHVRALRRAPR